MKTTKFFTVIPLLVSGFFATSVYAVDGIDDNDHAALINYYEAQARTAEAKLQENKALLEEYEAHPYYYGRQGQDFQAHTSANIHEYEEVLKDSLENADLHKKMAVHEGNNPIINKAKINIDNDSTAIR